MNIDVTVLLVTELSVCATHLKKEILKRITWKEANRLPT